MKKLLLILSFVALIISAKAQTDLIISEMVEGWSNNKALEIYNPTNAAINLSAYRITRYSNGTDVPPADAQWTIALPDFSLEAYKSYVVVLDKRDPAGEGQEAPVWKQLAERADVFLCPDYNTSKAMYFNGDDAVTLEKTNGTVVDIFGRWGAPRPAEATVGGSTVVLRCWTNTAPYFDGSGVGITAEHTMIKKPAVVSGVTTNPTIWNPLAAWDTLPANTFYTLGWHKSDVAPTNETPVFGQTQYLYSISSDSENGLEIGTITSTDNEGDAVKYYINYGNFVYINDLRIEPFAIGKTDGKLTLVDKSGLDPAIKDTFDIKVVATDGFSQTNEVLVRVLVDIEIGVKEKQSESTISVWPNPVNDNNINITANKRIATVKLTNLLGQEVFSAKLIGSNTYAANISETAKGVYVIVVEMEDNSVAVQKVILK
ncbi:MAG: hypothetical protein CVU09_03020 [Bacteroidetes bacterium HGW-Bacteroidetes-4]|jgi:hypothetical protein|nr:MAG: hypothetical protein CVU09_03020 [Bacteroidetes bacterium HGW-Bacteroidetes-4]